MNAFVSKISCCCCQQRALVPKTVFDLTQDYHSGTTDDEKEFLDVMIEVAELPKDIGKSILLNLSNDYLSMFRHEFPQDPIYKEPWFMQQTISCNSCEFKLMVEEAKNGQVPALRPDIQYSAKVVDFSKSFPALRNLSCNIDNQLEPSVRNPLEHLLKMGHPTLEILRICGEGKEVPEILGVNWRENFPEIKLLEENMILNINRSYLALCLSSAMGLMKPHKLTRMLCIGHFDILTDGSGNIDISALPDARYCNKLFLFAKSFFNTDQRKLKDKYPFLLEIHIYATLRLNEEIIRKAAEGVIMCEFHDLEKLRDDLTLML
jgi:hypothetical protein